MSNEVTVSNNNGVVVPRNEWECFAKGDVINFMMENDLEKISVEDGCGRKVVIKKNKNGEYKVQVVTNETL